MSLLTILIVGIFPLILLSPLTHLQSRLLFCSVNSSEVGGSSRMESS